MCVCVEWSWSGDGAALLSVPGRPTYFDNSKVLAVCVCVCVCVCVHACMHSFMYVRTYVRMYVCVCMYGRTYVCMYIRNLNKI